MYKWSPEQITVKKRSNQHLDSFKAAAQYVFNRNALLKEKLVRCNQAAFLNKNVRKAIMTRPRLLIKFRQEGTISSDISQKKHQNICVKLLQKTKKDFFNNRDLKR